MTAVIAPPRNNPVTCTRVRSKIVIGEHAVDHLFYRQGFAAVAPGVLGRNQLKQRSEMFFNPVAAAAARRLMAVGKRRPAAALVIRGGTLSAAVQDLLSGADAGNRAGYVCTWQDRQGSTRSRGPA
ncbi:MAG: hypothetical protein U1E63_16350 [Burkholderiales bacterium]